MKLKDSPFTKNFLQEAKTQFGDVGLYWATLILLTGAYVITDDKYLFMKFGYSGSGKTITDKISLYWADRLNPLVITSRLTPAGMGRLARRAKKNEEILNQFRKFYDSKLISVEDLSKSNTKYLRITTVSFLAGLTKNIMLDDLTYEGGGLNIQLSKKPKKCMLSGTPAQWEELTSSDIYTEYIDRRSLTILALLTSEEWNERKDTALNDGLLTDDEIVQLWRSMINESYRKNNNYYHTGNILSLPSSTIRKSIFFNLIKFKGFPENLMQIIDSLAKGHALLNGRQQILEEDYGVVHKLFSRFLYISDMKKKEFLIVEEILRNKKSPYGIKVNDLIYLLRTRSRRSLPEAEMVRNTLVKYADFSKYLDRKVMSQKTRRSSYTREYIDISDLLKKIFINWRKEVQEVIT